MPRMTRGSWVVWALAGLAGCSATGPRDVVWTQVRPEAPPSVASLMHETAVEPKTPASLKLVKARSTGETKEDVPGQRVVSVATPALTRSPAQADSAPASAANRVLSNSASTETAVAQVVHTSDASQILPAEGLEQIATDLPPLVSDLQATPIPTEAGEEDGSISSVGTVEPLPVDALQLSLASALAMVGGSHPIVGVAQWRVQEAYAQLAQAEVLWLPSIRGGFSFHRHDGNYQASNGDIVDVNRNSFQFGLGAGGTGAGTTQRPGVVAEFHLADAIFQPHIAQKNAWAAGHGSNAIYNSQLLEAAVAYLELLEAEQDRQILDESRGRTAELAQLTRDFSEAGEGLQADADRMATELTLIESRLAEARERIEIASARLAQALSIRADNLIVPLEPVVVPIHLVSIESDKSGLIHSGLANRPELKEAQALVAAACDEYKRQKYAPFIPSVLLGLSSGGFGGGLGNNLGSVDDRYDFDALMMWEVRNLGFGEKSARRATSARFQQAQFEKLQLLDQVAREVSESYSQVVHRMERVSISEQAIQTARDSFDRNLSRIRDGEGLPIEVLQSIRALEDAQRNYLRAVADHNEAQFRLQWAMGWPVTAPN